MTRSELLCLAPRVRLVKGAYHEGDGRSPIRPRPRAGTPRSHSRAAAAGGNVSRRSRTHLFLALIDDAHARSRATTRRLPIDSYSRCVHAFAGTFRRRSRAKRSVCASMFHSVAGTVPVLHASGGRMPANVAFVIRSLWRETLISERYHPRWCGLLGRALEFAT